MLISFRFSLLTFFLILTTGNFLFSQPDDRTAIVAKIDQAYNGLDYAEADRLLKIALDAIGTFSDADQVVIWQYAAFRAIQNGQPAQARTYFWKLLEADPNISLDPVTTSPKMITVFQQTRVAYLEALQNKLTRLDSSFTGQRFSQKPASWRSLLLPGWEQWRRGYKTKGLIWTGLGATAATGTILAMIRTNARKKSYDAATDPTTAAERYTRYRNAYRSQFVWAYVIGSVWFLSHIDASFFSPVKKNVRLSMTIEQQTSMIRLSYQF